MRHPPEKERTEHETSQTKLDFFRRIPPSVSGGICDTNGNTRPVFLGPSLNIAVLLPLFNPPKKKNSGFFQRISPILRFGRIEKPLLPC